MSFRAYFCCDEAYAGRPCPHPKVSYWNRLAVMKRDDIKEKAAEHEATRPESTDVTEVPTK